MIADEIRPTTISKAPAIPDAVSEKPCGVRIGTRRDEVALKAETYIANGRARSGNEGLCRRDRSVLRVKGGCRGGAVIVGGEGGVEGMKSVGTHAIVDCCYQRCWFPYRSKLH